MSANIPQPPRWPVIGNLFDIDPVDSNKSFDHLAEKYGEIFKLDILGEVLYIISSVALVEEVCDETRFTKVIESVLGQVRNGVNDGLFTAHRGEPNWDIAHGALMPAFGPLPISGMFDEMHDIASQLVSKWARNGPDHTIELVNDTTRLALDTIALCAMDLRFNSFYKEEMHPFVGAMGDFLTESGKRASRTKIEALLNPSFERKYKEDIKLLQETAQECIDRRKANESDKKDLLNAMLYGKDPKTGKNLTEQSVMDNMITFLIAGHETTSGLLSFTIYYLLKNPETWQKAQQEVDAVIGSGPVQFRHMSKLPYIEAVLRESIRLSSPVSGLAVTPLPGTKGPVILGGKYILPPDAIVMPYLQKSHRDPTVFGENANEFIPERMLDEKFRNLRSGAWKPFGNGSRGCIGRPFAWQEAILAMTLILQNFNLRLADPGYQLKIHQTLTQKPEGLQIKASLRDGIDPVQLQRKLHGAEASMPQPGNGSAKSEQNQPQSAGEPITILFGSTSGTSEGLAQSLASDARGRGYKPSIRSLDEAVDNFPQDQPVIIVACTYEGQPPDNAKAFVEWLKGADNSKFSKANIAVFACGHKDWVSTFHRVPKLIEEELLKKGATAIVPLGGTDVSQGTIFDDFDSWTDKLAEKLLGGSTDKAVQPAGFDVQISTSSRATHLHYNVQDAKVLSNDLLTAPGVPEKRHLVVKLPTDMQYEAGDYLAVLPINNTTTINRVLKRFTLPWDAVMTISQGTHATIPSDQTISVALVLGSYVELSTPATRKNKEILTQYADSPLEDDRGSVLDILERYPGIFIPFSAFIAMLPPLRLRQYSMSSSPLLHPSVTSITFSVLESGKYLGTATNYLKELDAGSTMQVAVKKCHNSFRLPLDDSTPIIMVCAGSGIAPFKGFLQERAAKKEAGKTLGEAVLFVGCRYPDKDKIFSEELAWWEKKGVVKVFHAFSRQPEASEGCKHVQDRIWNERELVSKLFDEGARAYVCGSSAVGKGVSEVAARIATEKEGEDKLSYEEALEWWQGLRGDRYAVDVFD